MADSAPRRWFRWIALLLGGGVIALALLVAALPALLSSSTVRHWLEREASQTLGRPVQVAALELGWDGCLRLAGVRVADDPAFSPTPLLTLEELALQLEPLALLQGRATLTLRVTGLELDLVRLQDGRTNLEALADRLTPPAPAPPPPPVAAPEANTPGGTFALPFRTVDLSVALEQLQLRLDDRAQKRRAALRDLSFTLAAHAPAGAIQAGMDTALWVDGEEVGPLHLAATVEHGFSPEGVLDLPQAHLSAELHLPGCRLAAAGGLAVTPQPGADAAAGFTASVALELGELWAAVQPFLPPNLAASEVAGAAHLELQAGGDPAGAVAFRVELEGSGLRAGGALLDGRRAGPLALRLDHRGHYQVPAGTLEIEEGRVALQQGTHLAWHGRLTQLNGPDPQADLALGPVTLDLAELHRLAAPFLPAGVTLGWGQATIPTLHLEQLSVQGPLAASGPADQQVDLRGLALELPALRLENAGVAVALTGGRLALSHAAARLHQGFPAAVTVQGSLEAASLEVAGPSPLQLQGLALAPLQLSATELQPAPGGPLPLSGRFDLAQELALARLDAGPAFRLEDLSQHLAARGQLAPAGLLSLQVTALGLRAGALDAAPGGGDAPALGLHSGGDAGSPAFALDLADLALDGPITAPTKVGLGRVALQLGAATASLGENRLAVAAAALHAQALTAELSGGFPRTFSGRCDGTVDGLQLEGPQPLQAAHLALPAVSFSGRDWQPAPASPFGVQGTLHAAQSFRAEGVQVPGHIAVERLRQELTLDGALAGTGEVRLTAPTVTVTLDGARVTTPEGELTLPLALRARADAAVLGAPGGTAGDVQGLSLHLDAGPLLALEFAADATNLGADALRTGGSLRVDAGAWSRFLPAAYRADGSLTGSADLQWSLVGRLPTLAERAALQASGPEAWAAPRPLPFLDALEIHAHLDGLGAELPLAAGERLSVGGVFTEPELHLQVGPGGESVAFSAPLAVRWLEAAPGLPPLDEPLELHLTAAGGFAADGTLTLRQTLAVVPLALEQQARLTLRGVRRLLARGLDSPPALWLNQLGGEAEVSLAVAPRSAGPAELAPGAGVRVAGPLQVSAGARLARGEEAAGWLRLAAQDAAVEVPGLVAVDGLDGSLDLEKHVRLTLRRGDARLAPPPTFLSETVLAGGSSVRRQRPSAPAGASQGGGLRARRVQLEGLPVPLQLDGLQLQLGLPGGLPALERLQVELLGGTVLGSVAVAPAPRGFAVDGGLAFTGLSTARLLPTAVGDHPEEAEVSGQLDVHVPLAAEFRQLLSELEVQFRLTRVGPRTLGQALAALDPTESNEAIQEQRRLVRHGRPRWAAVAVRNGNASLRGEVELLGAVLALPTVERVPVADLPGMLRLESLTPQVVALNRLLDVLAADRLEIYPDGAVRLVADREENIP